ncbi:hypothetical protein F7725_002713 [Dissostichus mawsoni]|uniref:Rho GTPase-activating protein 15 n=1 Tax=Dissostichus mawsoni TaxID=36200 RepID=A0A7J5Y339_DISMA|nr:hypothetical protein F7725_002713 [Dissostichus mawsoni]
MRMKSSQSSGERLSQSRSMVLQESDLQQNPELKGDLLNVAKISDGGKKQRKNWTGMWSELTSDQLLLHKERQQEAGMKAGGKTDVVQLCGAVIEWTPDKSSRKNVFQITTHTGSEYLLQAESYSTASKWFDGIKKTVDSSSKLPLRRSNSSEFPPRHSSLPGHGSTSTNTKQRNPVHRRSINMFVSSKLKHSTSDSADKNGVKNRLKKFIIRHRVFGCHLLTLCEREGSTVPSFVQLCLDAIEKRGMDVDGIYRVSGNLSTVQKLRFIVDQEEALDLDHSQWEDVHVVTGALKMFFRELPEPLFPFRAFQPFVEAVSESQLTSECIKIKDSRQKSPGVLQAEPDVHAGHRHRVRAHADVARAGRGNMAVNMVYQNQIIEFILIESRDIFSLDRKSGSSKGRVVREILRKCIESSVEKGSDKPLFKQPDVNKDVHSVVVLIVALSEN